MREKNDRGIAFQFHETDVSNVLNHFRNNELLKLLLDA